MHIRRRNRQYLLVLLVLLIVWGCKGKEETQQVQAPEAVEQQDRTSRMESVPSSEKPEVVQEPANRNTPPRITKFSVAPRNAIVGDTIKAETETLDGDEDTFTLKEAPSGMTIDPKKGFIQWKVPPDFTGTSSHTFSVTDGHGGETTGTFVIEIQEKQISR